jgi:anti-sigma regulatory factor (Ser/Thr protein kinase)
VAETLRLPPDVLAPAAARRWVSSLCTLWPCKEVAHIAALLVSELVTNVVLHARTSVTLTASFEDSRLAVGVHDDLPGDLAIGSEVGPSETGRGLFLVRTFAADCGVERDQEGKTVWFVLVVSPPPSPRPPPHVERRGSPERPGHRGPEPTSGPTLDRPS